MKFFVWRELDAPLQTDGPICRHLQLIEWLLVRAFLVVVLALELWERLKYLIQHLP
jgi:hypothetical protein